MRLPCRPITPFGAPVVPEVYWRKARSSGPTPASRQPSASAGATLSTATVKGNEKSSPAHKEIVKDGRRQDYPRLGVGEERGEPAHMAGVSGRIGGDRNHARHDAA